MKIQGGLAFFLLISFAIFGASAWFSFESARALLLPAHLPPSKTPSFSGEAALVPLPSEPREAIRRPIFYADRRPRGQEGSLSGKTGDFSLKGLVFTPKTKVALFWNEQEKKWVRRSEGESLGQGTVEAVAKEAVVVLQEGKAEVVRLQVAKSPKESKPARRLQFPPPLPPTASPRLPEQQRAP
mgnify:CR=1 FL=1